MKIANFTFKEEDLVSFQTYKENITPNRDWNIAYAYGIVIELKTQTKKICYSTRGGRSDGFMGGYEYDETYFTNMDEDLKLLEKVLEKQTTKNDNEKLDTVIYLLTKIEKALTKLTPKEKTNND